jgi:hypothetical protein
LCPEAFFTAALGISGKKQVKRLISIAQRISEAGETSTALYKGFWFAQSHIFQPESEVDVEAGPMLEVEFKAEVDARFRRLKQAISNYTAQGVNSLSAAINMVHDCFFGTTKRVIDECRNVVQITKEGCLALVLTRIH